MTFIAPRPRRNVMTVSLRAFVMLPGATVLLALLLSSLFEVKALGVGLRLQILAPVFILPALAFLLSRSTVCSLHARLAAAFIGGTIVTALCFVGFVVYVEGCFGVRGLQRDVWGGLVILVVTGGVLSACFVWMVSRKDGPSTVPQGRSRRLQSLFWSCLFVVAAASGLCYGLVWFDGVIYGLVRADGGA